MKNKILIILLITLIGVFTTTKSLAGTLVSSPAPVDVIDWSIISHGCVKVTDGVSCYNNNINKRALRGLECLEPERFWELCEEDEEGNSVIDEEDYEYHTLLDKYIEITVVSSISSSYRKLFSSNGGSIYIVSFDPNKIDLYGEIELEGVEQYLIKTYGIRPAYQDKDPLAPLPSYSGPNYANTYAGGRTTFFVCNSHSTCDECGKYTASNKATFDYSGRAALGYLNLDRYCPEEHACCFFWVTCNTNNIVNDNDAITYLTEDISHGYLKFFEGLECTEEKRIDDSYFCKYHTCHSKYCYNPIIGVNLGDGLIKKPTTLYEDTDPELYSEHCLVHFCWDMYCRGPRSNVGESDLTRGVNTIYAVEFPEYCSESYNNHYMNCTKYGCNELVLFDDYEKDYKNGNRFLCPTHMKEEVRLVCCQNCNKMQQSELTVTCYTENNITVDLCNACVKTYEDEGYIEIGLSSGIERVDITNITKIETDTNYGEIYPGDNYEEIYGGENNEGPYPGYEDYKKEEWNSPKLGDDMTSVNWDGEEWISVDESDWIYNYDTVTSKYPSVYGNGTGKWANAMTSDGSLYVWIPRYTYKIVSGAREDTNSWNSIDNPGKGKIEIKFSNGIEDDLTNGYLKHPAFTFGDSELEGIWVAKFEASRQDATEKNEGRSNRIASRPGVVSLRNLSISKMFEYAYNMNRGLDSHLMKNTEWGAVTYLTNAIGKIPYINNSSDYITGNSGDSQGDRATDGIVNAWDTEYGVRASTTHNIYGIYDLSGGALEYVSAIYSNGLDKYLKNDVSNKKYAGILYKNKDTKYVDLYEVGFNNIKGDAVLEVSSNGIIPNSWDKDGAYTTPFSYFPLFVRGGVYSEGDEAGIFYYFCHFGAGINDVGFRTVLSVY